MWACIVRVGLAFSGMPVTFEPFWGHKADLRNVLTLHFHEGEARMQARWMLICSLAILAALPGCGFGSPVLTSSLLPSTSSSSSAGRAVFTVIWPARERLIPNGSNSIVIQISNSSAVVASQTLVRPFNGGSTTAAFSLLPVGTLSATAAAHPQSDGTGDATAAKLHFGVSDGGYSDNTGAYTIQVTQLDAI